MAESAISRHCLEHAIFVKQDCSTAFSHKTPKLLQVAEGAESQQPGRSTDIRESHETIIFTQRQVLKLPSQNVLECGPCIIAKSRALLSKI